MKTKLLERPKEIKAIPSYWWCIKDRVKIPYHHESGVMCIKCGKLMATVVIKKNGI